MIEYQFCFYYLDIYRTIIEKEKISKNVNQESGYLFINYYSKECFQLNPFLIRKNLDALKNMQNELHSYQLKLNKFRKDLNEVFE